MKKNTWIGVALAACFACFWILLGSRMVDRGGDFLGLYTGAALAAEGRFGELYDRQAQSDVQADLVGELPLAPFIRPPAYAALVSGLDLLPYPAAFSVWIGLQVFLLLGAWAWAAHRLGGDGLVLGAMFVPPALAIAAGQDALLLVWAAIAFYMLAERGREFSAGAVLGLALVKFHLLLLLPFGMLLQRRFRMAGGFATCGLLQLAFAFAAVGSDGLRAYRDLLAARDLPRLHPSPAQWISLHSLPVNFELGGFDAALLTTCGLFLVVAWSMLAIAEGGLQRLLVIGLAGSLAIVPHAYAYDLAVLFAPLLFVVCSEGGLWSRFAAGGLLVPLALFASIAGAPWSSLPALTLLLFLAAVIWDVFHEAAPVEAAAQNAAC